ncbi:MAG: hypothetical protein K2K84_03435, partial [Muribaculaceae bacterium]|nr:hypothetical protein [Muribaculaceae bacterium]
MNNEGTFQEQRNELDSIINSLLNDALAIAPPAPLTEFRNAMDWNELGLSIMPTVRDFVVWYAVNANNDLLDKGLESVGTDSPIYYALQADFKLPSHDKDSFMLGMLDNRAAAYALYLYISKLPVRSNLSIYQIKSELDFLNKAKNKVEGSWVEETVDGRIKLLKSPYFKVNFGDAAIASEAMPVKIMGYNLDTLSVAVYSFESLDEATEAQSEHIKLTDYNKVYSNLLRFNNTPTGETVTDSITLPAGYYVLTAGEGNLFFSNTLRVCPWLFVTLKNGDKRWLQVLDIHTGAPIKGAEAFLLENSKTSPAGLKTDSKGCIELPVKTSLFRIGFRDGVTGKIIYYPRPIYPVNEVVAEDVEADVTRYNITTDRPIYRPGEKVRMVLTAYDNDKTLEIPEKALYVHLPTQKTNATDNAETKPIEITFGPTDSYGRSTAEFTVPEDCPLGNATVTASRDDRYSSICRIQIAEFKLNDLKIINVKSELTADSIIVRGMTANEAGIGIGNVAVNVNVNYNIYPRPDKELSFGTSTSSDANGQFIFSVPRYYFGNLKSWIGEKDDESKFIDNEHSRYTANISMDAMSPNGRSASAGQYVNMTYPNSISINLSKSLNNRAVGMEFGVDIEGYNPPEEFTWSILNKDEKVFLSGTAKVGKVTLTPAMLKKIPVGEYNLKVSLSDGTADDVESSFTLYDPKEKFVPTENPFLIIDSHLTGEKTSFRIGVKKDKTNVWVNYLKSGDNKSVGLNDLKLYKLNRGWHEIPVVLSHYDKTATVEVGIYTAEDDGGIYQETVDIEINPKDQFTLGCESFRDNLTPGTQETWQFVTKRNERPATAAVFVNLMNSKLTPYIFYNLPFPYIYTSSTRTRGYTTEFYQYTNFRSYRYRNIWDFRLNAVVPDIELPYWRNLFRHTNDSGEFVDVEEEVAEASMESGLNGATLDQLVVVGYGTRKKSEMTGSAGVAYDVAATESSAESPKARGTGSFSTTTKLYGARSPYSVTSVELREPKVYTALWEPMLTTGDDGRVDVSLTVPGESTGWELYAEAWTTDLLSARLTHSFTATKPVVVAPNPPRFVRVGDMVNLVAAVTN